MSENQGKSEGASCAWVWLINVLIRGAHRTPKVMAETCWHSFGLTGTFFFAAFMHNWDPGLENSCQRYTGLLQAKANKRCVKKVIDWRSHNSFRSALNLGNKSSRETRRKTFCKGKFSDSHCLSMVGLLQSEVFFLFSLHLQSKGTVLPVLTHSAEVVTDIEKICTCLILCFCAVTTVKTSQVCTDAMECVPQCEL